MKRRSSIPPLFKHQVESVKFMLANPRVFDASDPGTGKTRVQIEVIAARLRREKGAALIIAPKSLMQSAWQDDFSKFAPHIKTVVATAERRGKVFDEEADVYITNTDATTWLAKKPPKFFKRFHTLVIDEVSTFKHNTSLRSKSLNKIRGYFKYRYGLSGTPRANKLTDIWNPVFVLDDGQRLGKSFFQFRNAVCHPVQVGPQPNMVKWEERPEATQAVAHLISDITVRNKLEDCLDIPENHLYSVTYHMSAKQTKAYNAMVKDAYTQLDSGHIITAVNAAVVGTKLLQIASGASYSESDGYATVDTGRYELIADLVEQRQYCVVFFLWSHQRDLLIKEFKKRGITHAVLDGSTKLKDRKGYVKLYQAGFYRVLLLHPLTGAHGLTLVKGTTTIWASPTYNLEIFQQGNRRIYRAGQTQKTETIVVLAKDTIEDTVFGKLQDKDAKQLNMLDILNDTRRTK